MASSLSQLTAFARRITASPLKIGAPIYHTSRRLCHNTSHDDESYERIANLLSAVSPGVVALKTYFDPFSPFRAATGFFVQRRVLVTSAHAVSRVVGANCEVGSTSAIAAAGKVLQMRLLAVNFGGDVAVLLAVEDPNMPPPLPLSFGVDGEDPALTVITRHEKCDDTGVLLHTPTRLEDTSPRRPEWIHPVGDLFGWDRYGSVHVDGVKVLPGSPWVNLRREVVGIASWAAGNEPADSNTGFVVPPQRIVATVNYGLTKGIAGSLVMDRWIEAIKVCRNYDAPLIHAKELGNIRCGFVATASVPDSPLTEVTVNIDGVKITKTGV